ncbi:MAG: hypothetical protein RLZZ282_1562 [Verrucomicrobiota bacterium]
MTRRHQVQLAGLALALGAISIWARDRAWMKMAADTLPLAFGLLLAVFIGRPWQPRTTPFTRNHQLLTAISAVAFASGWVLGCLTLLTVSWTFLAMLWAHWAFDHHPGRARLAWLLLLSFPWLVIEWPLIGWAFRLSSATVAEQFFNLVLIPTQRSGTHLNILGLPIDIEPACAGWNVLQLTLLAGVALGTSEIQNPRHFSLLLFLLPGIAWLANLLRILILAALALSFDTQMASGVMHEFTGLAVLAAVLAMIKGFCFLLNPPRQATSRIIKPS